MTIHTERPGYIPLHIPKLLTKIGLAMLNETEIEEYKLAKYLIINSDKDEKLSNNPLLNVYGYFIPGRPIFPKPFVQLYKKKSVEDEVPERQLIVYYSHYCFQMVLPFSKNDQQLNGKSISLPIFPLLIDISHFQRFGKYQPFNLNLSSNVKKSAEKHNVTFSYESREQLL
jgi:hypothetical protein